MNPALVVVDVQNDFCTGSLAVPSYVDIVPTIKTLIKSGLFRVVFTKDWHPLNHSSFTQNGGPWPMHCVQGTPGADIHAELIDAVEEVILKGETSDKEEYGATVPGLEDATSIFVCGIAYDYCVGSTAKNLKRDYPDKKIIVITNASASIAEESSNKMTEELVDAGVIVAAI